MNPPVHADGAAWREAVAWRIRVAERPDDLPLRQSLRAWLDASPENAAAYAAADRVWRLTGGLAGDPVPSDRRTVELRSPQRPRLQRFAAVAASIAACLILLAALLPDPFDPVSTFSRADIRTATAEGRVEPLTDGSTLSLDARSAVDLEFRPEARAVRLLSGRAYFDVKPDPTRPFTVTAGHVTVTVTGTAFSVALDDKGVKVAVERGSVAVDGLPSQQGRMLHLAPGDEARSTANAPSVILSRIPPANVAAWRSGRLVADGWTVERVVQALRAHHRGLILLRDDALAQRRVTGIYDLRDPEAALRAAVTPHGGRAFSVGPLIFIDRP